VKFEIQNSKRLLRKQRKTLGGYFILPHVVHVEDCILPQRANYETVSPVCFYMYFQCVGNSCCIAYKEIIIKYMSLTWQF